MNLHANKSSLLMQKIFWKKKQRIILLSSILNAQVGRISVMTILRGKRLLCTTDLSHPKLQIERTALSLAHALNSTVTFLHVLEDAPLFLGPMPFEEGQKWEQLETRYRGELLAQTQMKAETALAPLRDEHDKSNSEMQKTKFSISSNRAMDTSGVLLSGDITIPDFTPQFLAALRKGFSSKAQFRSLFCH
ncbi:hypothetical protein EBR21_02595 [bacterium]|nr:hypothetical protein [bacterium]